MKKLGLQESTRDKNKKTKVSKGKSFIKKIALAGLISNSVNTATPQEIVNDLVIDTGIIYGNVDIHNIKGDYLLSGYTDETGKVTIPKTALETALQQNGFNYTEMNLNDVILNITVNTDAASINDDTLSPYGKLSTAGKIKDLNYSLINDTTTLVEKIVYGEWYGNIWEYLGDFWYHNNRSLDLNISNDAKQLTDFVNKSITQVIAGLDQSYTLTDTNSDGVINRKDIHNGVQEKLKQIMLDTGYSEGIKYGDYENMFLVERSIKRDSNFVLTDFRLESGVVVVRLDGITEGSYVEFSDNIDFTSKFDAYPDDDLYLHEGYIMHIRERFSDNTLGKVNTLKVVGTNIYRNDKIISTITTEGTISEVGGTTNNAGNTTTTDNTGTTTDNGATTNDSGSSGESGGSVGSENVDGTTNNENGTNTESGNISSGSVSTGNNIELNEGIGTDTKNTIYDQFLTQGGFSYNPYLNGYYNFYNYDTIVNLENQINKLKIDLENAQKNQTLYYNSVDEYTRNLLNPEITEQEKQTIVNNLLSDTNATSNIIPLNELYLDIPENSEISTAIKLLVNTQSILPQTKENWRIQYTQLEQEYKQKLDDYNNYMNFISNHTGVINEYDSIFNPINALGILENINLNVGYIINRHGVNTAINTVNDRFSQYSFPYSNNYTLDTTTKGRISTGDVIITNILGKNSTVKITYGSNLSFPATITTKYNGVSLGSLTLKNSQHALDIINYYKKYSEKTIILEELNKLKPIESTKNYLDSVATTNLVKYTEMNDMKQDYYLIPKNQYETIYAKYLAASNAEARFETIKGRLNSYGSKVESVKDIRKSIDDIQNEITQSFKLIVSQVQLVSTTPINVNINNNGKPDLTSQKYINTPNITRYYHNGGKKSSKEYNEYTYTSYAQYNRKGTDLDYPAKIWVDYKINPYNDYTYTTEKIEVISKFHQQEMFKKLHESVRTRLDRINKAGNFPNLETSLKAYFEYIKSCPKGCTIIENQVLKAEIDADLQFYAGAMFEYMLISDINFRNEYNSEINRQKNNTISEQELILGRPLTQTEKQNIEKEIARGIKHGIIRSTRDYLMQYIDLANGLSNLTFNDVKSGLGKVWGIISNPIDSIVGITQDLKNGIKNINNRLEHLGGYEYSYGISYTSSSLGLMVADPAGKILKLGKVQEIINKLDNVVLGLINNLLNTKIAKLGASYVAKFDDLSVKIVNSFDLEKQRRFLKRMSLMDDTILKEYLEKPDNYIINFEVGGKYNMLLKEQLSGSQTPLIFNDGKFRTPDGKSGSIASEYDYVLLKNGDTYELKIGKEHSWLARGQNVEYAGIFKLSSGKTGVEYLNNGSGHYKPNFNDIGGKQRLTDTFYKKFGIDISNKITNYE
ncbi:MAG: hypothetical protein PHS49_04370 [Candidatus Gracilibacteria bacterium]|nr:hypothetical protein [Candidatus Gracilibacteria bacterium]